MMMIVTQARAMGIFVAFVTMPLIAAPSPPLQYKALQQLLGLSDSELSRLQSDTTRSSVGLTDLQKRQLVEVASVLQQDWVYQAVTLGLISEEQWPGGSLCYDQGSGLALQISGKQWEALKQLRSEPKARRLKVLTDSQLKRLASYEAQLELVNQAIELGLILKPTRGERLCH